MFFFLVNNYYNLKKEIFFFKKINYKLFNYTFFLRTQISENLSIFFYNLNFIKKNKLLIFKKNFNIDVFFKKFINIFFILGFFFLF